MTRPNSSVRSHADTVSAAIPAAVSNINMFLKGETS